MDKTDTKNEAMILKEPNVEIATFEVRKLYGGAIEKSL